MTYFDEQGRQYPAPAFGKPIELLRGRDVGGLYDEARSAFSVNSYTAAVLCCRTLLMHIAVDLDAEKNKPFQFYIDYLIDNSHIPIRAKGWVGLIREKGNIATHEIQLMTREDATMIMLFTEMLLKVTYEYPAMSDLALQQPNNDES